MNRVALLLFALAGSACSTQPTLDYAISVDPTFTQDQMDSVMAGITEWGAAVPELRFTYAIASCDSPAPCQVCVHPAYAPPDPSNDVVGSTYPGVSDDSRVFIYVERIHATGWDTAKLTQQTTAHEIGHAVGLRHTGAGTLMAADVPDQAHSVTAADVRQFWSVRGQ